MGKIKSKNLSIMEHTYNYTYIPSGTPTTVYTLDLSDDSIASTMVMGMGWSCNTTHLNRR